MSKAALNIVLSSKLYFPILGGSVIYAAMLAQAFSRAGHHVTLVTRTPGDQNSDCGYKLIRCPSAKAKLRIASKADVLLQVESSWTDAWPFLLKRVPWFCTVHRGTIPTKGQTFKGRVRLIFEKLAYRTAYTIGVSRYAAEAWNLRPPPILNPYDKVVFSLPPADTPRDIDVLFVGRITRDKGVFVLVESLADLLNKGNKINRIAFVGGGPVELELRQLASISLPGVDILYPGRLDPENVAEWMRRSRILAFPTTPDWKEASPLTPLEAAACGCWVVAADSGGTEENVSSDHLMVKSGSAVDLSRGLSEALRKADGRITPATADLLSGRGVDEVAAKYLDLFQAMRRPKSGRAAS